VSSETGFEDVASEEFVEGHTRAIEMIIGCLYRPYFARSTPWASAQMRSRPICGPRSSRITGLTAGWASAQLLAPPEPGALSARDVLAHLRALLRME
jgi:hypothetical protein